MGKDIPPSDLVGQHPIQLQKEEAERIIINTLLVIVIGVTVYYASQGVTIHSSYSRSSISNSIYIKIKKLLLLALYKSKGVSVYGWMNGEARAIFSSILDVPPICSPIICPVIPPSTEPIQSLRALPIGTSNCVQKQIYDGGLYRYKWQEVCY